MAKLTRREMIKTMGAGVGVLAAGPLWQHADGGDEMTEKTKRPNILFVFTDQQHGRVMSCAGNDTLQTPAMDFIADNGIRFERGYACNPVCMPSRTGMATGVMPNRFGAHKNFEPVTLTPEIKGHSMGELMKRAGYDTFYGGKVHMEKELGPENGAYDAMSKDERARLPHDCLRFMTQKRNKPFFAVVSLVNPHDICFAYNAHCRRGSNVKDLYEQASALPDDELPPLPANFEPCAGEPSIAAPVPSDKGATRPGNMRRDYSQRDWRIYRWIYRRLTERVDGEIKVMLDGLRAAGLLDDTLIVFSSDHGDMDAAHRLASKSLYYEESACVPMLMMHKRGIKAGQVDKQHLVSAGLDFLPTFCDYAGIAIPAHLQGRSLRPVVEGRAETWRSYVVSEFETWRMIRSDRYKYVTYRKSENAELLFDMKNDHGEMKNLAADLASREVLREHRAMLKEWCERTGDTLADHFVRNE